MTVVIEVASARGVAERWRSQYQHPRGGWGFTTTGSAKSIHERLCALGESPKIDAVDEVIGNKSWTHINCDGCNQYVTRAVRFAGTDQPMRLCSSCVDEAARALKE